jgi:hypothetical protein
VAGQAGELAAVNAAPGPALAPAWDRFAHWSPLPARLLLAALITLLAASALVPINAGHSTIKTKNFVEVLVKPNSLGMEHKRDDDLTLYDRAIMRIRHGENYYDFIVAEHRLAHYPVKPGLAVRLPTLAYLDAWAGLPGQFAMAIMLLFAVLLAWWRRLGEEPGALRRRGLAIALLALGASLGLNRDFFVLHELWAGMLLALSFGLHRPNSGSNTPESGGKWGWSLVIAALALAIRELSLPFVMLMAVMAFWRGNRREGLAWAALAAVYLAALAMHLHVIAALAVPSDPISPSWLELRGLSGWVSNVVLSSNLRSLPHWLAGPLVMLMVFGWASWRCAAGSFAALLYLGYGLAFMIAGRGDNYYWGFMVAPAMFIGLAFVPRGLKSLWRAAASR